MEGKAEHPILRKLRENRERTRHIITTQAQLARRLDIGEAQLSRYLSSGRLPDGLLTQAASILGCEVAELYVESEEVEVAAA